MPRSLARRLMPPLLATLLAAPGCSGEASEQAPPPFLLGGIQINEPDLGRWHERLLEEGFNTVALTVYARQLAWDGAQLRWDRAELEGGVVDEMRAARKQGLRVVLILRVVLEHDRAENHFLWHGLIRPETDHEVNEWFASYGEYVSAWADVAEREGVDVLGIGSELSALTSTRPVERVPALEEYYLDEEKQALARASAVTAAGRDALDAERRHGKWNRSSKAGEVGLEGWLDERTAALAEWARQSSAGGDVGRINARRALLARSWRELIARTRERYRGALTYAANFDQYQEVAFWDALDVIGINAYFPLRATLDEHEQAADLIPIFERRWREVLGEIDHLREQRGLRQPVLFTELGYTERAWATLEPWAGDGFAVLPAAADPGGEAPAPARVVVWSQQPLEPLERAYAVRALRQALVATRASAPDLLGGLLWWKLSTIPAHRELESFVVILDQERADPVLDELRALRDAGGVE